MINRLLTLREREICEMMGDEADKMSFRSIVELVKRDLDTMAYKDRRWFKKLHNQ